MLEFNHNACWRHDISSMNFSVGRCVDDFAAFFGESVFPFSMPCSFVFPPRITIF